MVLLAEAQRWCVFGAVLCLTFATLSQCYNSELAVGRVRLSLLLVQPLLLLLLQLLLLLLKEEQVLLLLLLLLLAVMIHRWAGIWWECEVGWLGGGGGWESEKGESEWTFCNGVRCRNKKESKNKKMQQTQAVCEWMVSENVQIGRAHV